MFHNLQESQYFKVPAVRLDVRSELPKPITTKKPIPPPAVKKEKSEGYEYPVPETPFVLPRAEKLVEPPSVTYMYENSLDFIIHNRNL